MDRGKSSSVSCLDVELESPSGRLWLDSESIRYQSLGGADWVIPLARLLVIGEYTDDNGPHVDNHFLVFVTHLGPSWLEASFHAEGRDVFLSELGQKVGMELECQLYDSGGLNSRVMWPPEIENQPLFEFCRDLPQSGLWERMNDAMAPTYSYWLTDLVKSRLEHSK